jgi:hypothetical protein
MFEESLVETKKPKPSKVKVYSFPVAVLFHVLLITGLVLYSIYAEDVLQPPPIVVSFFSSAPPPPLSLINNRRWRPY